MPCRFAKRRATIKAKVPNFSFEILQTVWKKHAETWHEPLKNRVLVLAWKECKTNRNFIICLIFSIFWPKIVQLYWLLRFDVSLRSFNLLHTSFKWCHPQKGWVLLRKLSHLCSSWGGQNNRAVSGAKLRSRYFVKSTVRIIM
jgi:hypothetical protein